MVQNVTTASEASTFNLLKVKGEVSRFNRTESIHLYKLSNLTKTGKAWTLKRIQDDMVQNVTITSEASTFNLRKVK
ncbi:hypothetical protein JF50_01350 [Pseudoalteromonas luteoviolacea]|uniref:Uncharacterized protein n=1 Tax=Pseudoalteromonas luteoviolacea TaxID=43657 RepID=A0A0C1MP95_9GAMM|nr:hypothetical protein JF50_01350 [Pseudoalteromonas luteoviolacea]